MKPAKFDMIQKVCEWFQKPNISSDRREYSKGKHKPLYLDIM